MLFGKPSEINCNISAHWRLLKRKSTWSALYLLSMHLDNRFQEVVNTLYRLQTSTDVHVQAI